MAQQQDDLFLAEQFEKIFTEYYFAVKYFAFMLLKSTEDAEDIAQDVFAKLWTQPEIWTRVSNLPPYVYTLTKSMTLNFIKREKIKSAYQEKMLRQSLMEDFTQEDPLHDLYYKEIQLIIRLTLDRLPEQRRKIFEMSRFENMSNHEIAERLNISVRTVEHHIYLALLEMKKISFLLFFPLFFK